MLRKNDVTSKKFIFSTSVDVSQAMVFSQKIAVGGSEKEAYSFAKWLGFKGLKSLRDIKPSRILIDCGDTIFFFLMEFDAQCANFIRNMRNQTLHLRNFFAFKYFLLKFCRIAEYRKAKKLIRFIV